MSKINISSLIQEMKEYQESNGNKSKIVANSLNRVIEIQHLLDNKFSLALITDKGMGKTSIINYALGLEYERKKKLKNGREVIVYQDVLETGAGATTTSETEIIQSLNNYSEIEIIPNTKEEMDELLKEFAKYIFKEVYKDFDGHVSIPSELLRAMRNMTGLKDIEDENGKKVDLARHLAKSYTLEEYSLFEYEVLKRANLEARLKTKFFINKDENEKKTIRSTFNKINLMNIIDVPLPKKIIIKLSKEIFDFDMLGPINSIIDTRGLESGVVATDRKDIKSMFKNDKNKVILLVDKFNSPSQSIMKLIDTYVQEEDIQTINRLAYLVNFRDGEPENVLCHSGKSHSEVLGIETKCQDIQKYMRESNIAFNLDNIIFTNPKRYLDSNGKILVDEEDIDDYGDSISARKFKKDIRFEKRLELLGEINRIANNYRNELIRELEVEAEEFKNFKNREIENLGVDFTRILKFIDDYNLINNNIKDKFSNILEEYILSCHHSILMALNNRFGIYNNKDIYLVGSNKVESLFRNFIKDMTLNTINLILEQVKTKEEKEIIKIVINDIKRYYISFMDEVNNFVYEHLRYSVFNKGNSEFWTKVVDRWGKGSGYVDSINESYSKQLDSEDIDEYINNSTIEWINAFKNGLIAVINEYIYD